MSADLAPPLGAREVPAIDPDNLGVMGTALALAAHGIRTGPILDGTKNPGSVMGPSWQHQTSCDPARIVDQYAGTSGRGLVIDCGASDLVVIDVDHPENVPPVLAEALPTAPFQSTRADEPGRGHYLFLQPPGRRIGNSTGRLGTGWGEVRGISGVVVTAPSTHAAAATNPAARYQWVRTGLIPVLPVAVADLLPDAGQSGTSATSAQVREFHARHTGESRPQLLQTVLRRFRADVAAGQGRHPSMVSAVFQAAREVAAGLYSADAAGGQLRREFLATIDADRLGGRAGAEREFRDAWLTAIGSVTEDDVASVQARMENWLTPAQQTAQLLELCGRQQSESVANVVQLRAVPEVTGAQALDDDARDDQQHSDEARPTWAPVDLAAVVAGDYAAPVAEFMPRSDGVGLLYPGRVHSLAGEPESGKSLLAQAEVARVLAAGGSAVIVDGEDVHGNVVSRLLAMGAPVEAVLSPRFRYVRPEVSPSAASEAEAWRALLAEPVDVVVIDGVTEFLGLAGASSKDGDDVTAWMREVPRRIARSTGAAVVLVDHVTKDRETRGRWAIGSQSKLAACDAAYVVDVKQPLGRGMRGLVILRVAKDRPGGVRPHAGDWRQSDRTAEVARVSIDSTGGETIRVVIDPPAAETTDAGQGRTTGHGGGFRPTALMEGLSKVLEVSPEPLSRNLLTKDRDVMRGRAEYRGQALDLLLAEGYVVREPGPNNAQLHRSVRVYRQSHDPSSDQYDAGNHPTSAGGTETPAGVVVPGSPSYTGEPGNHPTRTGSVVPGTTGEPLGNHWEPLDADTADDRTYDTDDPAEAS